MLCPPLVPRPVDIPIKGDYSWAYTDRTDGTSYGSANRDILRSTAESMVKPWIVADYLRRLGGEDPPEFRLRQAALAIEDSDDDAAESLYRAGGGDAVIGRLIDICGLTDTTTRSGWWSYTTMTVTDADRMGLCLADGRGAGRWTDWLHREMQSVRGDVGDQHTTSGGGRWGIIDGLPHRTAATVGIKNGWTPQGNEWHVNCLAVHDTFVLTIMLRYPYGQGLAYGADRCAEITRELILRQNRVRFL